MFALLPTALGAGIGFIVATFLSLDGTAKAVLIIRVHLECRFAALAQLTFSSNSKKHTALAWGANIWAPARGFAMHFCRRLR